MAGKKAVKKAAELFEDFHGFPASETIKAKIERKIPKTLVKVGDMREIIYHSDKWSPGRTKRYLHDFEKPYPLLCSDTKGRRLYIIGGEFEIKPEGIVN